MSSTGFPTHMVVELCFSRGACEVSEGFVWRLNLPDRLSVIPINHMLLDNEEEEGKRDKFGCFPQTCFVYLRHILY